jgi:predicted ATP-dependent endonuclease of OLD family
MRIDLVQIHNYRSVRDVELKTADLIVLLGPNNHGKSNILGALEFALSTSAKITRDDVCAFCEEQEPEIWVELTFTDLTEQEQRTFEKYVRSDGSVKIRKTAKLNADSSVEVGYRGYIEQPDIWWLQTVATERLGSQDAVQAEAQSAPELLELLEGGGRIKAKSI